MNKFFPLSILIFFTHSIIGMQRVWPTAARAIVAPKAAMMLPLAPKQAKTIGKNVSISPQQRAATSFAQKAGIAAFATNETPPLTSPGRAPRTPPLTNPGRTPRWLHKINEEVKHEHIEEVCSAIEDEIKRFEIKAMLADVEKLDDNGEKSKAVRNALETAFNCTPEQYKSGEVNFEELRDITSNNLFDLLNQPFAIKEETRRLALRKCTAMVKLNLYAIECTKRAKLNLAAIERKLSEANNG